MIGSAETEEGEAGEAGLVQLVAVMRGNRGVGAESRDEMNQKIKRKMRILKGMKMIFSL